MAGPGTLLSQRDSKVIRDAVKPINMTELGIRDSANPRMLTVLGFGEAVKAWTLMRRRML